MPKKDSPSKKSPAKTSVVAKQENEKTKQLAAFTTLPDEGPLTSNQGLPIRNDVDTLKAVFKRAIAFRGPPFPRKAYAF